jgi:dihydrofolate reductase
MAEGDNPGKVFVHFTMSLDGFIADTTGRLDWAFRFGGLSATAVRKITDSIGAVLAGRRGYDLGMMRGDQKVYGGSWSGPQFVLTHRPGDVPADPSVTFLSGSIRDAVGTARAAAGGKDVVVMGASMAQQCLAEGLVDEILLHLMPIVLGDGIRLFAGPLQQPITLRPVSVEQSGDVTSLRFRLAGLVFWYGGGCGAGRGRGPVGADLQSGHGGTAWMRHPS